MVKPPNLWLAILYGLAGSAAVAAVRGLLLHAPARHLLRHHHADLLADLLRHHLHLDRGDGRRERPHLHAGRASAFPASGPCPSPPTTLHWFVLAVVTASYLILRRITQSPFGMVLQSIRENEARTRAIGYPVERYKMVAVMLSGLFAGLAGVLYAVQNRFAAPDFVYFLISGEVGDLQRHGRHRHAGGADRRRRLLPRSARGSRLSPGAIFDCPIASSPTSFRSASSSSSW